MRISEKLQDAINKQVNHEFYAAYLYLAMAAHFESENMLGFASWMKKQAKEETTHAMKFYNFLYERMGKVTLGEIKAPKASWASPLEAFQDAYNHEVKVTQLIGEIGNLAILEKDHATQSFLKWFFDEQVEEESQADQIVQKLKMIGDHKGALYMLDKELGSRQ